MIVSGSPVIQKEVTAGAVIVLVRSVGCMVIVTEALLLAHPPLETVLLKYVVANTAGGS